MTHTATAYSIPCVGIYEVAEPLSGDDWTIVALVVDGVVGKQIAARLGVHEKTVKYRIRRIARFLPGGGSPRDRLLLWAHVLLRLPKETNGVNGDLDKH